VNDRFIGDLKAWDYTQMYMVYSANANTLRLGGEQIAEADRSVALRGDGQWNAFPCLFDRVTPIAEALADYYDDAVAGDLLKAHDRFAVFSADKRWEGDLKALRPGEGYLFRRIGHGPATVRFFDQSSDSDKLPQRLPGSAAKQIAAKAATNMTMIARVVGLAGERVSGLAGERVSGLAVYVGDELAAVAEPLMIDDESYYFLTIQSDKIGELRFMTDDGQELVPTLNYQLSTINSQLSTVNYQPDSHHGTLKKPVLLTPSEQGAAKVYKIIEDDRVVIIRNNEKYDIIGNKLQ
jgi:hypothetical protein